MHDIMWIHMTSHPLFMISHHAMTFIPLRAGGVTPSLPLRAAGSPLSSPSEHMGVRRGARERVRVILRLQWWPELSHLAAAFPSGRGEPTWGRRAVGCDRSPSSLWESVTDGPESAAPRGAGEAAWGLVFTGEAGEQRPRTEACAAAGEGGRAFYSWSPVGRGESETRRVGSPWRCVCPWLGCNSTRSCRELGQKLSPIPSFHRGHKWRIKEARTRTGLPDACALRLRGLRLLPRRRKWRDGRPSARLFPESVSNPNDSLWCLEENYFPLISDV